MRRHDRRFRDWIELSKPDLKIFSVRVLAGLSIFRMTRLEAGCLPSEGVLERKRFNCRSALGGLSIVGGYFQRWGLNPHTIIGNIFSGHNSFNPAELFADLANHSPSCTAHGHSRQSTKNKWHCLLHSLFD
jgi:hypothetical protein